jgi:hypothetical protein
MPDLSELTSRRCRVSEALAEDDAAHGSALASVRNHSPAHLLQRSMQERRQTMSQEPTWIALTR